MPTLAHPPTPPREKPLRPDILGHGLTAMANVATDLEVTLIAIGPINRYPIEF